MDVGTPLSDPNCPQNTGNNHKLEGSRRKILGGDTFEVNSLHHQGLQQIAPALKVVALAPDQLVEAVELPDHPFGLAVQWHPEWLQEHAPQRALFRALIQASSVL